LGFNFAVEEGLLRFLGRKGGLYGFFWA